jgi:hypothetical protein
MTQPERQAAAAEPRARLLTGLGHAVRLGLFIAIGLLGWSLVQTCRDLFATAAPTSVPEAAPQKPSADVPSLGELLPGGWALGASDWTCASRQVAAAEVAKCLQGYGEPVEAGTRPADLERAALNWLRKTARRRSAGSGLTVYEALLGTSRVRAVSQGFGTQERLRLAQLVGSAVGGQCPLYEVQPSKAARGLEGNKHLLPLPGGVASAARRWDQQGGLSAEVVGPAASGELANSWRQAGWSVERAGTGFVCRKGDEAVLVWKWGPAQAGANEYLLLVPAAKAAR